MTATIVDHTNFTSEVRVNILALLDNRSNVGDPVTGSSANFRKMFYTRHPDNKSLDFHGYPYVVLHPSAINFPGRQTVDIKKKEINWSIEIEVVASDREANNMVGKGMAHMDAISDDIVKTLNNTTNLTTLRNNAIKNVRVDVGTVVDTVLDNVLVFNRSFLVTCRTIKTVTA